MLVQVSSPALAPSMEKRGTRLHRGALECTEKCVRAARGLWPRKTAAEWAAKAGVKERIVKYWLAGKRPVSDKGKLAIIREIE